MNKIHYSSLYKLVSKSLILSLLILQSVSIFGQTSYIYNYSGGIQTFIVPVGVTTLNIQMAGASGATPPTGGIGGQGGTIQGILTVTPGTILNLYIGGAGSGNIGGYNGGGQPQWSNGGGGGGATDIRIGGTNLGNRVMVAGGGGGGGNNWYNNIVCNGGNGGSTTGAFGQGGVTGGGGGTQSAGGIGGISSGLSCYGGTNGSSGTLGVGGGCGYGGAGGGGFYGGGGGSCHSNCYSGGGGGGSSWVSTSIVSGYSMNQGGNTGNGYLIISVPATPTAVTLPSSNLNSTHADLNGTVSDNGLNTTTSFEYGTNSTLSSGSTMISGIPSIINSGSGNTPVSASINGLIPNTTYYYRLVGSNSIGTSNGNILNFTTPNQTPNFIAGDSYALQLCQNSNSTNITPQLHVSDIGNGQTETWSIAQFPNHGGQLTGFGTANSASGGGVNIAPSNSVTYTPALGYTGTESFAIQVTDGISSDTLVFTVSITPSPVPVILQNGNYLSTGNFAFYQWYLNGTVLTGGTNSTVAASTNGIYSVAVTDSIGCQGTSLPFSYQTAGINEVEQDNFLNIYPNPSKGNFHISFNSGLIPEQIELYNPLGFKIHSILPELMNDKLDLDLNGKTINGVYFLRARFNNKIIIKPLMIVQ